MTSNIDKGGPVQLRIGYEMVYDCPGHTPMILMTHVHYTRVSDLVVPDHIVLRPSTAIDSYRDSFGNWCTRLVLPPGETTIRTEAIVNESGQLDPVDLDARQHTIQELPHEALLFLMGSRYCETDRLSDIAWQLFGHGPTGWQRVQAICDFAHGHITFGYPHARSTRSALEAFQEQRGVCRDFAHLAITLCRVMNIPARYCTGYLSDVGVPPPHGPMDFAAWMEVYIGHRWHTFDPRNNERRIGRVLIARGRDAADVPISNSFGPNTLKAFQVWTDEHPAPLPESGAPTSHG